MFGVPVKMLARDGGSDETLFQILDGSGRVAVVHLTWAKGRERPPWPCTRIYPNLQVFAVEEMIPKNRDYLEE